MFKKHYMAKRLGQDSKIQRSIAGGMILSALVLTAPVFAEGQNEQSLQQDIKQMSEESQRYFQNGWREGKIETSYLFSEHLNNFDIDAEVQGETATLKGNVSSEVEKDLAEEIALSVEGVKQVKNQLTINPDAKKQRDKEDSNYMSAVEDASITALVKTRLLAEGEVPGLQINVDTEQRKVTLQGEVESEAVKALAEQSGYVIRGRH